jgi:hypothetical protein
MTIGEQKIDSHADRPIDSNRCSMSQKNRKAGQPLPENNRMILDPVTIGQTDGAIRMSEASRESNRTDGSAVGDHARAWRRMSQMGIARGSQRRVSLDFLAHVEPFS